MAQSKESAESATSQKYVQYIYNIFIFNYLEICKPYLKKIEKPKIRIIVRFQGRDTS